MRFGRGAAVVLASASTFAAWVMAWVWSAGWPLWTSVGVSIHACLLVALALFCAMFDRNTRIDGVLLTSLTYAIWFIIVPLIVHP